LGKVRIVEVDIGKAVAERRRVRQPGARLHNRRNPFHE
jgi:hypothetical protein